MTGMSLPPPEQGIFALFFSTLSKNLLSICPYNFFYVCVCVYTVTFFGLWVGGNCFMDYVKKVYLSTWSSE